MMQIIAINRYESSLGLSVGMAVEYPTSLNIYSVDTDTFSVSGRRVLDCYVNTVAALREGRDSVPGRYIILELEPEELQNSTIGVSEVYQHKPVRYASGQVAPTWAGAKYPIALNYKQVNGCQHSLVRLRLGGELLSIIVAEPRDYAPHQRYPLYVEFARSGEYHQGEMFGLIFRYSQGWETLPDDHELLVAAGKVFQHTMYVYNIDPAQVHILGMALERADRILDARFPSKAALENPLRAKWVE